MYCSNCGKKLNKNGKCPDCNKENSKVEKTKNDNKSKNNKELSNILGIVSLISAFFVSILNLPMAIISIVVGHKYKKETGEKCYGPVLSIISICIAVLILLLIIIILIFIFIFVDSNNNINHSYNNFSSSYSSSYSTKNNNYIFNAKKYIDGEWYHKSSGGNYEFDLDDREYKLYNTSNHNDNYCTGTFSASYGYYEDNNYKYTENGKIYYTITLYPRICKINGEYQNKSTFGSSEKYEGILDYNTKTNLTLISSDNQYVDLIKIDD